MTDITPTEVICAKRDGEELSEEQIRWFIDGFVRGAVADEQAAALLMAVVWRGLSPAELSVWTAAMIESGQRLDLSTVGRPTVDKHSTGGVGDKVSLVLCPLLAACGVAVPQMAGRGLGHTGGTLDKLEAIPGWSPLLDAESFVRQLDEVGAVIAAATDQLAPADRRMYALRDVTGTVESVPLIAASIMSKKVAEGTRSLVLDVKVGSGAFADTLEKARELARTMVDLGVAHGVDTSALVTDMDQPLGRAVGNSLEVDEAIACLDGGGPADVVEVTLALARRMLEHSGRDVDPSEVLASGRAAEVWELMVAAQGGDLSAPRPTAGVVETITADRSGWISRIDAAAAGRASSRLGAGRLCKEDRVSPAAGLFLRRVGGDWVIAGEVVIELHGDDPARIRAARALLQGAVEIGDDRPPPRRLVHERLDP